jgi:O-antigen ligase
VDPTTPRSTRSFAEWLALIVVCVGAVAVVLASLPFKSFELDRFFIPKEFVLHTTAGLATLLCFAGTRKLSLTRVDTLLIVFLGLSVVATVFADNWWLATRALAITISGLAVFRVSRELSEAGLGRWLLLALAVAVVVGALTALMQAYGMTNEYASLSRAPGGTFGNRNFMAHLCAIGIPVIVLLALTAQRAIGFTLGAVGLLLTSAALMLSRSRAAYLALMLCFALLAVTGWRMRHLWHDERRTKRAVRLGATMIAGVAGALLLPNTLNWNSETPYLDSVRGVVNYQEGSGKGRLVQYRTSLKMAGAHPLLGVGPGNWPVDYPQYAKSNDPSLSQETGLTSNPWPSSDWIAFVSERGAVAFAALVLAMIGLLVSAWRAARQSTDERSQLGAMALAATVVVTAVVAAFDAVLLLAIPALFVWAILGVLVPPAKPRVSLAPRLQRVGTLVVAAVCLLAAGRAATQMVAMSIYDDASTIKSLERAERYDPGSYRIRMRLANSYARRGDCARVREHASAAREMFPHAAEPKRLLRACRA